MSMRGEIKDFLTYAMATHKMAGDDENSAMRNKYYQSLIDNASANRDLAKQRLGLSYSQLAQNAKFHNDQLDLQRQGLNDRRDYMQGMLKQKGNGALVPDDDTLSGYSSTPSSGSAQTSQPAVSDDDSFDSGAAPTPYAGAGSPGASYDYDSSVDDGTRNFAAGGPVGDSDSDDPSIQHHDSPAVSDNDQDDSAPQAQPASQPQGGTQMGNSYGFDVASTLKRWSIDPSRNPVKVGMDAFAGDLKGNGAVDSGVAGQQVIKDIHTNKDAANQQEVTGIDNALDKGGELAPSARAIARLDAATNYWLAKGDVQKASNVAKALLLYGKAQSQQFGDEALTALKKGDMAGAVKYITQAYDQVPDGQQLKAAVGPDGHVQASVVGADGKEQPLGAFGPEQVYKLALGVKSGTEYMNRLSLIASGGANGQPKPMQPRDFNQVQKNVDEEFGATQDPKNPLDPNTGNAIKNTAVHMFADPNNRQQGMTANEAVSAAAQIALPDPKNPMTPNFKVAGKTNGGVVVKFNDGRQAVVPTAQFDQLAMLRTQRLKALQDQQTQSNKPGMIRGMLDSVNQANPNMSPEQAQDYASAPAVGG
jgi:hypothetical protein